MKKEAKPSKERKNNSDTSLGDLGLEPPKLYRDAQKKIIQENSSKKPKKNQNLSRNQQRELQSKKRKKKNKLRKILIWFVFVLFVACVCVVLSLTVFFNIEKIEVSGSERYSAEEILAQCTIDKGENLFLADAQSASDMLEKNLPYIYNAEIHRKIPSTIVITVTDARPSYYIENEDKSFILLDNNFKVLEAKTENCSGIQISKAEINSAFEGHKIEFADENTAECLEKMARAVSDNNITEITAIYSNSISDNYLVYDNRIEFKIGTCDNIENKLYQGLTACEQLNESSPNVSGVMTLDGGKQIYFTEN